MFEGSRRRWRRGVRLLGAGYSFDESNDRLYTKSCFIFYFLFFLVGPHNGAQGLPLIAQFGSEW